MELGEAAADATEQVLGGKQDSQVDLIVAGFEPDIGIATQRMRESYDAAFSATLHQSYGDTSAVLGITIGVPDAEEVRILDEGGRRLRAGRP